MRRFDPSELPFSETHRILLGGVAPRPIAFVSTLDAMGRSNLAPFSFFNAFGVNPPVVCFSPAFAGKTGAAKDTMLNLVETGECTISIITHDMVHQASLASAPYERGIDEFEKSGFTKRPSERVRPAGVAESPFVMEAKLLHHIDFGKKPGSANMMICEILLMHVSDSVLDEAGSIDPVKLDPVARMGGQWYTRAKEGLFKLPQPTAPLPGIDALPDSIRNSPVLTGAHLAKLASVPTVPAEAPDLHHEELHRRHHKAKEHLDRGEHEEAWKILIDPM